MKHRKRDPGNGVSSSKSNISRAVRAQIPELLNFRASRKQQQGEMAISHSEQPNFPQPTSSSAMANPIPQAKRSSDRNRRSHYDYGFENSSSNLTFAAPPKRPHWAVDVENFQPPPASVVETVQQIAEQQPEEADISPIIGQVSPLVPQVLSILEQETPTLVQPMTVFEAENQETIDE